MTDKQIGVILNDIVIIHDTREQKNTHVIEYLDEQNIPHIRRKMDTGDYSFVLPNNGHLGLDMSVLVERKASLNEIAGNLTKDRERFIREFERVDGERMHLVLENATWTKIYNGTYRSKLSPNSFVASLLTISNRYDCKIWTCTQKESPKLIYEIIKYELREKLKNMG